ncbi:MAG: hypothetical protein J5825_01955 [Lachnospiraceae bacterium]|nr:hypothetical protein [Lachnospiraceae bacterium]
MSEIDDLNVSFGRIINLERKRYCRKVVFLLLLRGLDPAEIFSTTSFLGYDEITEIQAYMSTEQKDRAEEYRKKAEKAAEKRRLEDRFSGNERDDLFYDSYASGYLVGQAETILSVIADKMENEHLTWDDAVKSMKIFEF